jgi:hypothetical protein
MYNDINDDMGYPIPLKIKRRWINLSSMTFVIEWLATLVMIIAAVGIVQKWPSTIWILNAGSVLWLVTAYLKRQWSLFAVNFVLLGVYIYGLFL